MEGNDADMQDGDVVEFRMLRASACAAAIWSSVGTVILRPSALGNDVRRTTDEPRPRLS